MTWNLDDYPVSFKNLEHATPPPAKKAIDIANSLLKDGYQEQHTIPIATEKVKEWHDNASKDEIEHFRKHGKTT